MVHFWHVWVKAENWSCEGQLKLISSVGLTRCCGPQRERMNVIFRHIFLLRPLWDVWDSVPACWIQSIRYLALALNEWSRLLPIWLNYLCKTRYTQDIDWNCTLCTYTGSRRVSGRKEIFTAPSSGSMRTDLCLTSSPVWTTSPSTPPSLNHTAWTVWRRWGLLGQFLFLI